MRHINSSCDGPHATITPNTTKDEPDRHCNIKTANDKKRRQKNMRNTTTRATSPSQPQPETTTIDTNRAFIPRPRNHRHKTTRTRGTRNHHGAASQNISLDRNRTRPYDCHGVIRHPSGPFPAERQLDGPGRVLSIRKETILADQQTTPPNQPPPNHQIKPLTDVLLGCSQKHCNLWASEQRIRRSRRCNNGWLPFALCPSS